MIREAYAPGTVTGLLIYAATCQVKNLSFQNFNWNGLTLRYACATNNTISGCWLGVDYTGSHAAPDAYQGVLIYDGASGNIVGGTNALARNVLSGNTQYGVLISGTNTASNVIRGNYIGTDAGGSLMVSNAMGGVFLADGTSHNIIGGTNAGAGNVISGNLGNGILLRGSNVVNNTVLGNFIGTDATGTNSLPNTVAGVTIDTGSSSNLIGGTVAGARNVISGNNGYLDYGVIVAGAGTSGNVAEGNYIGLGSDGVTAVSNYFGMTCSGGATTIRSAAPWRARGMSFLETPLTVWTLPTPAPAVISLKEITSASARMA
jgi:titin